MSKRELIDRIRLLNRSAREAFLQAFNEDELAAYLEKLECIKPREDFILPVDASNN